MKDIYEELKELTSIPAVSGHEDRKSYGNV
jgi:hypothetical protein